MDHTQHSSPNPGRRAEIHDGDVLTPHPEVVAGPSSAPSIRRPAQLPSRFDVPVSALAPLFRARLERIYRCRVAFDLDLNTRATTRVLGGYYKTRRLVRVYVNDTELGRRPLEELFDTFLHEVAHHLEYTEPTSFSARACGRVPGRMHSRLFWKILGEIKYRWVILQRQAAAARQP
ncbi:MAG: hypothetical protein P4L85_22300 [Paludisphaera borealis]|uniref:hypothetical protein n=1 Tax=Paludisphaera borealis TaxID=1387353 RepID=UPI00284DA508|nr:hypothetical protein [Paludisphaera borealis]MDR3622098.1 hypothetical protein [Paludisphaera borealis]